MDNALRVYHHGNLVVGHIKEPVSLHNLQALVSQGRGIQSYLLAHAPIRMIEALGQCYVFQLTAFFATEGTAGGGNDQTLHFAGLAPSQSLENSAMLAVHRSQVHALIRHGLHHNTARRHQGFLVG